MLLVGACRDDAAQVPQEPTVAVRAAATTAMPLPTEIGREGSADGGASAEQLAILPLEPVGEVNGVTFTMEIVGFPEGIEARPGPWSPDGSYVVTYVLVPGRAEDGGPMVRVWTVDVESASPAWDSGDVEDGLDRAAGMAAWRSDAVLALPRADGMLVQPDGANAVDVLGIAGQPRELSLSPDGSSLFVNGPDGAWLVGGAGDARAVAGRPSAGFDSWSWSPDGTMIGLARANGDYYVIDVPAATAERIAKAPPAGLTGRMPPPRWLTNGRLLLSNATAVRTGTGPALDHLIVNPEGGRSESLPGLLEIPLNVTMPVDASTWVSPDGAWIVYPVTEPDVDAPAHAPRFVQSSSLLVDVSGAQMRALAAVVDPLWSPDNRRVAFRTDGALAVFDRVDGAARIFAGPEGGVGAYGWSPDGLWLLFTDGGGSLWILAADRQVGPTRLADAVVWAPAPTWAPGSDRFAATVLVPEQGPRLAILSIGPEG